MNQYKVMENVVQNDKFLLKVKDEVEFCEFRVNFVFQICSFFLLSIMEFDFKNKSFNKNKSVNFKQLEQ